MKKSLALLLSILLAFAPDLAQAQFNKSTLSTQVDQQFPDNTSGSITPSTFRTWFKNGLIPSFQQYTGVNAQVGTSYTIQQSDYGQLVTFNNASPIAVTLPQAIAPFNPFNVLLRNLGTSTVTVTPQGGSTINGISTLSLTAGVSARVVSDGTNYQVFGLQTRTPQTAPLTIFVNGSTGSDSNNGLTAGAPFLTPQKAINTVCNNIDLAGNSVLIDLSDNGAYTGAYSGSISVCGYTGYSSALGQAQVIVRGPAARSSTCVNYPTLSGGITGVSNSIPWTFKNLQINGTVTSDAGTFIALDGNCHGATSGPHVSAVNAGSKVEFINSPYTINGAATGGHGQASFGGEIIYQSTASPVTITGTPAMGGQFVTLAQGASLLCQDVTFTGALAAVTKRYVIDSTSSIKCGTTSVTNDPNAVLPGDTAGTGLGVSNQLLSSNGPGNGATFNDLNAFLNVTSPITKSGTSTVTIACGGCLAVSGAGPGDANYTIVATDRYVHTTTAFTLPRTWTLPAANAVAAGTTIIAQDSNGAVTATNTLSVARAGADTINGSASSIVISTANGGTTFTSDGTSNWGTPVQTPQLALVTNSLGGDVALNAATYTPGPSVAQGTVGTWFASGTITITDTAIAANVKCKLWDGTTVIASAQVGGFGAANVFPTLSLSGYLAAPAGNIRIECIDNAGATGKILFNQSGNSKDSTLSALRVK